MNRHNRPQAPLLSWPPPPEPLILPAIGAPEDAVPIVDRLTLLFQARFEWVIAESLGLPSPLDRGSARRPARRSRIIPWQWFSSN